MKCPNCGCGCVEVYDAQYNEHNKTIALILVCIICDDVMWTKLIQPKEQKHEDHSC